MLRSGRLRSGCLAVALALTGCEGGGEPPQASSAAEPEGPLNVVLITLDTVRADALNPYGQPRVSSPVIDRMAREGVLFEQVASSSPSTLPSHTTILTGRFPPAHGVRSNSGYVVADENQTLAEVLKGRGYRTGAEIGAAVLDADTGLQQGFDHYRDLASADVEKIHTGALAEGGEQLTLELEERPAADISRFGRAFLDRNRARSFFLWLHYFDPHRVYVPRPAFQRQLPDDPYLAEILYVDSEIGALLEHLEALGLRERTLVVLVADHGEGLGEHGENTHSFLVYESTIRVPLLFWGPPALPRGRRIPALVRTADIAPTILDLVGAPIPHEIQGRSLAPLLRGEVDDPALPAYGESIEIATTFGGATLRYLRMGDWKYIHQPQAALYDLAKDPGERDDLARAHPERVQTLRRELERVVNGMSSPAGAAVGVDPARSAQLEALGYAVGASAATRLELDSLELHGPAPATLVEDLETFNEASGQARAGLHERAVAMLEPLVARHPESPVILGYWARSLDAMDRKDAAREAFERLLTLAPCSTRERHRLSLLLGEQKDWAAQLGALRAGVEQCAESYELLNEYAYALATNPSAALRDGAEAVRAAERAVALAPTERAEILDTLAAAYAEAGDFARAQRTAERAVELAERQRLPPALVEVLRASLERYRGEQPTRRS